MPLQKHKPYSTTLNAVFISLFALLIAGAIFLPEQGSWIGIAARVVLGVGALANGAWYFEAKKWVPALLLIGFGIGALATAYRGYGFNP